MTGSNFQILCLPSGSKMRHHPMHAAIEQIGSRFEVWVKMRDARRQTRGARRIRTQGGVEAERNGTSTDGMQRWCRRRKQNRRPR